MQHQHPVTRTIEPNVTIFSSSEVRVVSALVSCVSHGQWAYRCQRREGPWEQQQVAGAPSSRPGGLLACSHSHQPAGSQTLRSRNRHTQMSQGWTCIWF
jgi:hypothetical protein